MKVPQLVSSRADIGLVATLLAHRLVTRPVHLESVVRGMAPLLCPVVYYGTQLLAQSPLRRALRCHPAGFRDSTWVQAMPCSRRRQSRFYSLRKLRYINVKDFFLITKA